jgi:hypothetical protein
MPFSSWQFSFWFGTFAVECGFGSNPMRTDHDAEERAIALAWQLKQKIEKYYSEQSRPDRHVEMNAIQAEIEKLGFLVVRQTEIQVSAETGDFFVAADVTLYKRPTIPTSH